MFPPGAQRGTQSSETAPSQQPMTVDEAVVFLTPESPVVRATSNARVWHAEMVAELERKIAAMDARWGECVHGPDVVIKPCGVGGVSVLAHGKRSVYAELYRPNGGPVLASSVYIHGDPSAHRDTVVLRGDQDRSNYYPCPDLQAAVDFITKLAQ